MTGRGRRQRGKQEILLDAEMKIDCTGRKRRARRQGIVKDIDFHLSLMRELTEGDLGEN